MKKIVSFTLVFLFIILLGNSEEKLLFFQNFDKVTLKELIKNGIVKIPKYSHWKIEDGALVQAQPKYFTGRIIIGKDNWKINKIEFDFKRIERGLKTKHGYDNHTGVRIWGLTIWARWKSMGWTGHIPPSGNKPPKAENKKADFEFNKWYHFKAERGEKGEVKIYINGDLFTTIPYSPKGIGPVVFYTYRIKSAFDNIKIYGEEIKSGENKKEVKYNYVPNSSFEYTTNPDLPDNWSSYGSIFHWGLHNVKWTTEKGYKEWHKKFYVDRKVAFHGKNSLRVEYPVGISSTFFEITGGRQYVFSAYMKSNIENLPVKISLFYPYRKKIIEKVENAGKRWKRFSIKNIKTPDVSRVYIAFIPLKEGTLWVDAVQLEEGKQVTPYSPSPSDEEKFGQKEKKRGEIVTKIPSIILKRETNTSPVIDGNLDDLCWKNAPVSYLREMNGTEAKTKTEFRVCYDKKNIYLGIKCYNPEGERRIIASEGKRDSFKVFGEDSVEIFITPEENPVNYFHLAINAAGLVFDQKCKIGKGNDVKWDGIWEIKTGRGENFWTVEVGIPFENFIKEKLNVGRVFRINICRNVPAKRELLSWSYTPSGFHAPDRFGYLYMGFSPIGVSLKDFSVKWNGLNEKELSFLIKNNEKKLLNLKVNFISGEKYTKEINLSPEEEKKLSFNIFNSKPIVKGMLDVFEKDTGKLIYSKEITLNLPPFIDPYFELSYYTSEKEASLYVEVNLSDSFLKYSWLNVLSADGKLIKRIRPHNGKNKIKIPVKKFPEGKNKIKVELKSRNGTIKKEIELIKLPESNMEVKIDRTKDTILVNGKPIFPFSLMWEEVPAEETLKYIADSGFKVFCFCWRPGNKPEQVQKVLDAAKKYNLLIAAWPSATGMHYTERGLKWKIGQVKIFKDSPVIFTWNVFDEPGKGDVLQEWIDGIKKADPYRLAWTNYHSFALKLRIGGIPGEIISLDRYPIPNEDIHTVESTAKEMYQISSKRRNPLWYFLQNGGYAHGMGRSPTPEEEEYMTYIVIIEGVRGIYYFSGIPKSAYLWEKIKQLNKEVQTLAPVLFSNNKIDGVKVNNSSIRFITMKHRNAHYIISVNREPEKIKAEFDLSDLKVKGKIANVLFENRRVKIEGLKIKDTFGPYQRHVYEIMER